MSRHEESLDAKLKDALDASFREISAVMETDNGDDAQSEKDMDWILAEYDKNSSDSQNLNEELKRLQTLRSYLVLDTEREFPFERLTGLASRLFNVPIALVSLVDLGRQWFMSNRGLGDVRETPRSQAFCAHAIISTEDLFIIQDATKDFRFKNNPLVTDAPNIRFYAGAPLRAPEGYKIGTFCIIDSVPRPDGLSFEEKQNLQELGALAVQVLVQRRMRRERNKDKNSQLVACAAHDLLTPLSGIELSLNLLLEDEGLQKRLNEAQTQGLKKAVACSSVLQDICKNVRSTFSESKSAFELTFIQAQLESFNLDKMIDNLYTIIDPIPKKVPVVIQIDDDVPREAVSDVAKIFRCAMIYLTVACARTEKGMIVMRISSRLGRKEQPLLYVSCEDTAAPIPVDCYENLFKPLKVDLGLLPEKSDENGNDPDDSVNVELALFSVACQMNVVGGEFGFRPRGYVEDEGEKASDPTEEDRQDEGSVFWFSIPYSLSSEKEVVTPESRGENESSHPRSISLSYADASQFQQAISTAMDGSAERAMTQNPTVKRQKRALVIEDSHVVRKMLAKLLTRLGYGVTEAENGLDGLVELKGSLYDIVLCDFLMPAMDGLDCVQQYRDWENIHRSWLKQWIIGISAHASEADVEKGLKVGMNHFMPKPVTFASLSNLLKSDDQVVMSKRLDELEVGGGDLTSGDESGYDSLDHSIRESKRLRRSNSVGSKGSSAERVKACLVLSPYTSHIGMVQDTIKGCASQSALGQTDREAWNMLKMRMWDLVLVDESFTPLIVDFRKWESSRRKTTQGHIILMSESVHNVASNRFSVVQPPGGFDEVVGKPFSLVALKKTINDVSRELKKQKKVKALFSTS
jgi:CheY-like chemotaxis protein/signal transduction histidine kinase